MNNLTKRARVLRKNMTEQESKLWKIISDKQFHGYKFLRQYVIGRYIVDFVCREKKIVIEIDGGQHNIDENTKHDELRTNFLMSLGYKVIRFWNNEIDNNLEGVYEKLQKEFEIK